MSRRISFFLPTDIEVHARELVRKNKAQNISDALRVLFQNGMENSRLEQKLDDLEAKLDTNNKLLKRLTPLVCRADILSLKNANNIDIDEINKQVKEKCEEALS